MIDLQREKLLSLSDACRSLPTIGGKRPHTSTLWRWCRKGVRGVHLEYLRLGNRICTSLEALNRFGQELAQADTAPGQKATSKPGRPRRRSENERDAAIAKANAELESSSI